MPVLIKYIKQTKFNTLLFIPIDIEDALFIRTKNHNGNQYIFLNQNRVKKACDLISGTTYEVSTHSWVHNSSVYVNYHLTVVTQPTVQKQKPITSYLLPQVHLWA